MNTLCVTFGYKLSISILLVLFSITAYAYTPTLPPTCEPCKGGMTQLTLRYVGSTTAVIKIEDNKEVYFNRIVAADQTFTINGTKNNGTFEEKELDFLVNGTLRVNLDVDCRVPIYVGFTFGDFVIVAGESRQGGTLCCSNVTDNMAPVFAKCPSDIELKLAPDDCVKRVSWIPPAATDNCLLDNVASTHLPGTNFKAGKIEVVYTATDVSGNQATCSFNVIIRDVKAPELSYCPNDVSVKAKENENNVAVTWNSPSAYDNCNDLVLTSSHQPGDLFPIGTTRVTYTAKDKSNNVAVCEFKVIVETSGIQTLVIHKSFTPDNDGHHDIWMIEDIEQYKTNTVTIVDRWGNVVFTTTGYDNRSRAWDGTDKSGKALPEGTYFYSIQLNNSTAKGFIELIK